MVSSTPLLRAGPLARVLVPLFVVVVLAAASCTRADAATVGLGTAGSFGVLGGSAVTNTGPTVIAGDLGVAPGTAVSGFPPGTVSGAVHANDAVAVQAKSDLVTAYDDAAGRSSTATVSGDLAGRTLTSGVYTSATSLGLSGDLTLDAQGDPNAVFVFQAGSTLTTASASRVLLIGGAQACNVFWQVGSSATLGSATAFTGTILALTSISLTTGATVDGRALARNGAVTLDTNVFTRSACTTPVGGPTPDGGTPGGTPDGTGTPGGTPGTPGGSGGGGTPGDGGGADGTGTRAGRGGRTGDGTSTGDDATPPATIAITRPATRIGCVSARLGGRLRAGATAAGYRFQFGTTTRYGQRTAAAQIARGGRSVAVNAQATRLRSGTTYHYRLVVTRRGRATSFGADRSFRTTGVRACSTDAPARPTRGPQGFTG
jgi:hypothetical protein